MDLNECVFVFEPMICPLGAYGQTHTGDCLIGYSPTRGGKSECLGFAL